MSRRPNRIVQRAALCLAAWVLLGALGFPAGALGSDGKSSSLPPVGLLAIQVGDFEGASHLQNYGYVVLNAWDYPKIPAIRATDPDIKILVYKDMSSTRSYGCHHGKDDALLPTGVGYCWADTHHPGWFLRDQTGSRMEWRGYSGSWWMDVGKPAYRRAWRSNVVRELKSHGWDGVMVDNTILDPVYYLQPGESIPKYPKPRAYRAATRGFLRRVGPKIAAGFEFIPNIGGGDATPGLLRKWCRYTTGFLREYWSRYGTGHRTPFGGWDWDLQMAQMDAVVAKHKTWLGVTYGSTSNTRLMHYAEASFLLAWDGKSGALFYRPVQGGDPWSAAWTPKIGSPVGRRFRVGSAWRRDFTGGTVLVNPSSSSVTVRLGSTYVALTGKPVRAVTLAPITGTVLRSG